MERKGFLQLVAEDLNNVYGGDYSDVTVVFPNKRASLFMNNQLTALGGSRPMWTPQYVTISEIFESLSDFVVADSMYLVCTLFQVYCRVMGRGESLDRFYAWGELMVSDFDDIDNNMADAKALFANISDLDDLTGYEYMSENQREAIRQFFSDFNANKKKDLKENFQSVWQHLYAIYEEFRHVLMQERKAYSGMLKRHVVERIGMEPEACARRLASKHYVVVGFNVLNETEKQLFRFLKMERETLFYWDYDRAYIDYEAGSFILANKQMFPNRFEGSDYYDNFATDAEKQLAIISASTEDAQCRYLSQWLQQPEISIDNKTAIVLCNEQILGSVLHSIPTVIDDKPVMLNVTMGFPLSDTPVYSFICALLDLQTHGRTQVGNWRYTQVAAVLKHPYTAWLSAGACTDLLTMLNKQAILYPGDEIFSCNGFLTLLFTFCPTSMELTRYLSDVIERIGSFQSDSPLFSESIYNAYTLVGRVGTIQETVPAFNVSKDTYSRLLRQLMRSKSIPFHGEPAIGLQVMGLLETRNLDFDNVIMLSVNEGQMPRVSMNNTFIPYTLRSLHGMTTIEKQTSLYAYYFYRILQRAKHITLMYNSSSDGLNQGEMSRFLMQLQIESKRMLAPCVEILLKTLVADNDILADQTDGWQSSPTALERLHHRFNLTHEAEYTAQHGGAKMTMSPSAINDYLDCRRRFFLKYVVGMKSEDELSDDVDDAMFGTLLHYCMERIYRPCVGRQVQSRYLLDTARDDQKLSALVDEAFAVNVFKVNHMGTKSVPRNECMPSEPIAHTLYNGHQLLNKHVLVTYIKMQLQYDARSCPFKLLGVESPAYAILQIKTDQGVIPVRFGGIIDRYEQVSDPVLSCSPVSSQQSEHIRIVDYKTSSREQAANDLASLFDPGKKNRSHHILQALYYCDVLTRQGTSLPVFPELMYVKLPLSKRSGAVRLGKEPVTDFQTHQALEYHAHLEAVIQEIFNPHTVFSMTTLQDQCNYCDFKSICGR